MRANPAGNCAFSGRPRTFVLLNGSVAHKGLFHAGKLRSNCALRSLKVCASGLSLLRSLRAGGVVGRGSGYCIITLPAA